MIDFTNNFILDQLPGIVSCKNPLNQIIYANSECINFLGLAKVESVLGKTPFDLPSRTSELAEKFQLQDRQILQSGTSMDVLDVFQTDDECWEVYSGSKKLIRGPDGEAVGILLHEVNITNRLSLQIAKLLSETSKVSTGFSNCYQVSNKVDNINLNAKDAECLFHLLRGKTAKGIARVFKVTPKAVEFRISKLRDLFGCASKSELIEKSLCNGYIDFIPKSLFSKQLSVVLS